MPLPVDYALLLAVIVGLAVFYWRQLRLGGRWGQRPAAQRVFALGGVLVFGGLLVGMVGLLLQHHGGGVLIDTATVLLLSGELLIVFGPGLARHADNRRSQRIRRGLGLD